ncbi:molecular chaperone DnaJ [Chloroflexales bacterium ZM16-3]|nr:molecular chaperone DnaJ [Chloroflexales bacterium ZM16-3]
MALTLDNLIQQMLRASEPEDVFGKLGGNPEEGLRRQYRAMAVAAHPDHNPGQWAAANEAFRQLKGWYEAAQRKLADGSYDRAERIRATSGGRTYVGYADPICGDLCDLFLTRCGTDLALLKVARSPRSSDLLQAEARALRRIDKDLAGQPVRAHFPTFIESFTLRDTTGSQRHVNVLRPEHDTYTLAEVLQTYPRGIHPADAAWMFNRTLAALGTAHGMGLVHGAVLPEHVLIRPSDHNGILLDWCYSGSIGEPIKAISRTYADDYPPEVAAKQAATSATDLYMAARLMVRLLGGGDEPPDSTPKPIHALLRACLIPAPARRHSDAWQVLDDFHTILGELYGPPTFRPFRMP